MVLKVYVVYGDPLLTGFMQCVGVFGDFKVFGKVMSFDVSGDGGLSDGDLGVLVGRFRGTVEGMGRRVFAVFVPGRVGWRDEGVRVISDGERLVVFDVVEGLWFSFSCDVFLSI